jgi:N-carbamoyl-L-amino-acid hydrolase
MVRPMHPSSARVIADLEELRALTADERGAQRVAWGPVWRKTRAWFVDKVRRELGVEPALDGAANCWVTLPGASKASLVMGSHLDSVPGGGWLDGCLGVLAGLEVLRRAREAGTPPITLHLVDWADEEGARFGRSLTGSAASAGTLDAHAELAGLVDRQGVRLPDALAENGVSLDGMTSAAAYFRALDARAYLELHIEQGPVLESLGLAAATVSGAQGVERSRVTFTGQAAHAGSTPMASRRDALAAAARLVLGLRDIAARHGGVCTAGRVDAEPGVVTAIPGRAEVLVDQRSLDAAALAAMLADARALAVEAAEAEGCEVAWEGIWSIDPTPFDDRLIALARQAVLDVTGADHLMPSGPLHDACSMARRVPTVMLFASSTNGLSHCPEEDTPEEHLLLAAAALGRAVDAALRG